MFLAHCPHVVAELGVAGHLEEAELPIEALAQAVECLSSPIFTMQRALGSVLSPGLATTSLKRSQ